MAARRWSLLIGFLLAFAVLVIVAAAVNPGYLHSRDYVSSLASRGADQAWLGMLALACFSAAHAVTALLWRRIAVTVWGALLACATLGIIVALARASCPGGAASCSLPGQPSITDLGDTIHGLGVGLYLITYIVAAICAGIVLLRHHHRGKGAAMLVLALLSLLASGQMDERTPGAEQRAWLAVNALGLVMMARFATSAAPVATQPEGPTRTSRRGRGRWMGCSRWRQRAYGSPIWDEGLPQNVSASLHPDVIYTTLSILRLRSPCCFLAAQGWGGLGRDHCRWLPVTHTEVLNDSGASLRNQRRQPRDPT